MHRELRTRRYVRCISSSTDPPTLTPDLGLRRTALPLAVLRLVGQGSEFVAFVLLARWLGTSSFGALAVAYLIARYGGLVADWGASIRGSRDIAARASAASVRTYLRWRALVGAALAGLFLVVSLAVEPAVAALAVCVLARGLNRDWWSLGRGHGTRAGATAVVQGGVLVALVVLVRPGQLGPAAAIVAVAFTAGTVVSLALNRLPRHGRPGDLLPDRSLTDPWILVVSLADQVLATADTLLLALLGSTAEAGVYAAVYRLPNAWLTVLGLVVAGLVPGTTAAVRNDPRRVDELRKRLLRVGVPAGASVVVMIPVAVWAVPVIFGEAYRSGRAPAAILLAAVGVATVTAALLPLVLALGRDRPFALGLCGVAALNVVANVIVIPLAGPTGAATVTLCSQIVVAGLYLRLSRPDRLR